MSGYPLFVGFDKIEVDARNQTMIVGIGDFNRLHPVWCYWFPMLCWLKPDDFVPRPVGELAIRRDKFIYPIELRCEAVEWCANTQDEDLIVTMPTEVERAVKARRAIVVFSLAHDGRVLYSANGSASSRSVFDKLVEFASAYDLPREQLWFINGTNGLLQPASDLGAWQRARSIAQLPFTFRICEQWSYFMGAYTRENVVSGQNPTVHTSFSRPGKYTVGWRATRYGWIRREFPGFQESAAPWPPAKWRYACLNRRFRRHRWRVLERLNREGALDYGLVSFPLPTIDELISAEVDHSRDEVQGLIARLPIVLDRRLSYRGNEHFDEIGYVVGLSPSVVSRTCAMEIVTETCQDREGLDISEKTFKGLVGRGPFIVVGNKGVLSYLHSIGAETWNNYLDESYDQVDDPDERLGCALDTALNLLTAPAELDRIGDAAQGLRSRNLRWLIEASKPWDELMAELKRALADL